MKKKMSLLFCLGAIFLIPTVAMAVTDFYVASYGGTFEKALKEELAPIFEKKFDCRVNYVLGISTETLAKVRVQKDNPQIDVTFVDDGPAIQGGSEGLWANLDPKIVKNLSKLYDIALHPNNNGVDMGVTATGLLYNTQIFKEKGFARPPPGGMCSNPNSFRGSLCPLLRIPMGFTPSSCLPGSVVAGKGTLTQVSRS